MRSGLAALLVAPFTASALAAGRGQESAGSEAESSDRAEGRGATDEEIVLGVSAAFSGPSRGLGTELYRGAMAYFNDVNENGGIEGRRVSLKLYDDGYQPDPCVQNTMRLMLEDKVFLLFGYVGTPTVTRVLPILKKFQDESIFLFFPFTGAQPQREPPYGEFAFNLRASYNQETAGLVDNLVRIGRRRIAVFYQIDAYGRSGWAGVRAALEKHGERLAGEATYSRGEKFTGSMRKQVEILQGVSPDAVICIGAYAACAAFARDAVDLGLDVPIANLSFVGSENLLKLLTEGQEDAERYTRQLINSQVVPSYEDTSIPAVQEYRDLMARYDPQVPADLVQEEYAPFAHSFGSLEGFLNAKLLGEILRRLGPNPDRAGLEEAVFSIEDFDLGISERVSFGPDRRQGLQSVYHTVVEDGRFVPLDDWGARFG
ncbi:MAG: ABC transporter substrate-binding protein [Acidobacteriota bacterium]|nr:ABC transporter substrate-binding protein [Acidobacteriota bacterium]MDE2922839.1 ABC transporter substrate-binding protein [Acidobacteriota bacterium]MDE3263395.1 ABC transporter substrate-binding protein [Acidobacteriota bacterium]